MSLQQDLIQFVADRFSTEIDEEAQLIDRGLIDSMGLLEIITFIEERTGSRIPDEEVTPENFQTVASIDEMVQRLRAQSQPPVN